MKKHILLVVMLIGSMGSFAQVFSTAETLKPGTFSFGIEPMIIASGTSDFILFGHVGYGVAKGVDLGAKIGILGGATYIGADMEMAFLKNYSLSAGAHAAGDFGLDATFIGTYSLASNVNFYGGADLDINFGGNIYVPIWLPIGVEVQLNKSMAFLFEVQIGVTSAADHKFGGGVNIYF
jgi:hypothetical protein